MSRDFPFELEYRGRLWRVQPMVYRGEPRVNVWAWYRADGGEWRACSGRRGEAGFVVPLGRLDELATCLSEAAADLRSWHGAA